MTYLQHNEAFLGTGEKNSAGQTLETFLEAYNPKKYDNPCNTVDIAVFQGSWEKEQQTLTGMRLLMIRRGNHPNIGFWALPGGFVELRENLADAARRELMEETGVTGTALTQLGTWGDYDRDPRWRVITTLYAAVIDRPMAVKGGDDAADALWFDVRLTEGPDGSRPETGSGSAEPAGSIIKLSLTSHEAGLVLTCEAACRRGKPGTLEEDSYRLLSSDRIAGDHGLMIIDAARKTYHRLSQG